ncbi:ABC transporter permease subunit [Xylophilus rhododendri]|uniref:ABC transporter permease subunit n=1 Tax=Xylophilus rhododendri TaxID=2697032 RepID=A0A857J5X9_9BURK|nr:ABC transporter permease [Xylophilus rhododendri]QHI98499.1 ABC transporter permease subunit [Xylophilus rhododendri]
MTHLFNRLLTSLTVLMGVIVIGFVLIQVAPADPAAVRAGASGTAEEIAEIRTEMGLDRPVAVQLGLYVWRLAHLDLGRSMISSQPVSGEIASTIGPTVELMLASVVWSIPLAIALGVLAAYRRGRWVDRLVMLVSVCGVSLPVFWIGMLLIQTVGGAGWLPYLGRSGPLWTLDGLLSIALPAITLGSVLIGPVARITRTAVIETLGADYVRTARAKGAGEGRILLRHALRNAWLPIVTLVGLQVGNLLGGAVVTEQIFSWPGVGRMAVSAIFSGDYPLAQGAILVTAVGFLIINLAVDMLYAALDPRGSKQ